MSNQPIVYSKDPTGSGSMPMISQDLVRGGDISRMSSSTASRVAALDFTKGALVLFMVLYHWLVYFYGPSEYVYRYLRFLPPSFIFITGFLISSAYLRKYDIRDPRLPKRLALRGLKILSLFTLLNVAIGFLLRGLRTVDLSDLVAVYVTGNVASEGGGKVAAFNVLVPISYLLLLSAALLIVGRFYKHVFYVFCALSLLIYWVLNFEGLSSVNLELVIIGLIGLIVGYAPIEKINSFTAHPIAVSVAYLCYTVAITLRDPNYVLQIVGVCLTLALIYLLGRSSTVPARAREEIILLGTYPLFGYIAQIAILQMLRGVLRNFSLGVAELGLTFAIGMMLVMGAVVVVDRVRSRSHAVDWLYKGIFA